MHRRKDLWGPDGKGPPFSVYFWLISREAEEFDPDRFLDYRLHKYLTPQLFIFLHLNASPRTCLGQQVST